MAPWADSESTREVLLSSSESESEFIEMRKLVIETINLTRAAMRRGLTEDDGLTMVELLETTKNLLTNP